MKYVRKFFLFVTASILATVLTTAATLWSIRSTAGNREVVKQWLTENNTYDNTVPAFIDSGVFDENQDDKQEQIGGGQSNYIDSEVLETAARDAITPQQLRISAESIINGVYDWLEGNEDSVEFTADFSESKDTFINSIVSQAEKRTENLPVCTDNSNIPTDVNIFTVECIPPGFNVDEQIEEFRRQLSGGSGDKQQQVSFLEDPVFTASDITFEENGEKKTIEQTAPSAPDYFNTFMMLTIASFVLGALLLIAVVFLSATKRAGIKHIAKTLLFSALSLSLVGFGLRQIPIESQGDGSSDKIFEDIAAPVLRSGIDDIGQWHLTFAYIYGLLGMIAVGALILTHYRNKRKRSQSEQSTSSYAVNTESETTKPGSMDAPEESVTQDAPEAKPNNQPPGTFDSKEKSKRTKIEIN